MTDISPRDERRDPVLGEALRSALDGSDSAEFIARMQRVLAEAERDDPWEILARWAPRGLAAAAAAAALLWMVGRGTVEPPAQPLASAPVQMEVVPGQSEAAVLTVAVLEGR